MIEWELKILICQAKSRKTKGRRIRGKKEEKDSQSLDTIIRINDL